MSAGFRSSGCYRRNEKEQMKKGENGLWVALGEGGIDNQERSKQRKEGQSAASDEEARRQCAVKQCGIRSTRWSRVNCMKDRELYG
jgi:hypothetical protein